MKSKNMLEKFPTLTFGKITANRNALFDLTRTMSNFSRSVAYRLYSSSTGSSCWTRSTAGIASCPTTPRAPCTSIPFLKIFVNNRFMFIEIILIKYIRLTKVRNVVIDLWINYKNDKIWKIMNMNLVTPPWIWRAVIPVSTRGWRCFTPKEGTRSFSFILMARLETWF